MAGKARRQIEALITRANQRRANNTKGPAQMRAQGDVEGETFVVRAGEDPDKAYERWQAYRAKG